MQGFAITGGLGAGKSTVQRRLAAEYGFWIPTTVTTRSVGSAEDELTAATSDEFSDQVRLGEVVFPHLFASHWYGWRVEDLERILRGPGLCVLNVRPYTALVVSALNPSVIPVWLAATPAVRALRLADRAEQRDGVGWGDERAQRDSQDSAYEPLFRHRISSATDPIPELLSLIADEQAWP